MTKTKKIRRVRRNQKHIIRLNPLDIDLIDKYGSQRVWQVIYDFGTEQVPTELTDFTTAMSRLRRFAGKAYLYIYKRINL